jgi:uncharacterized protein (DUF1778 family)
MRTSFALVLGWAVIGGIQAFSVAPALAANCAQGADEERIACLNQAVSDLETKLNTLTQQMEAMSASDVIKWNDRISLRNEDMRLFPRCLENPGPDTQYVTDVFANSCAKVAAQSWMVVKPYH